MKASKPLIVLAIGLSGFLLGCFATYWLVVRDLAQWVETQPLYVLAEETNFLKELRAGQEARLTAAVEENVWRNVSLHAARANEGKSPPETLRKDIAYHCSRLDEIKPSLETKVAQDRAQWCATLQFPLQPRTL